VAGTPFTRGTMLAGRFALDDLLDEHDGAAFWRATDRTLARSVAVHVLPDSDRRAERLLTAARTSALVSDGHLLRVLDASAGDGMVYVVNEWGSGASLDRLLADGPLSPRRAAWVVKEVAEAVSTAHRNGVAHGRLLPQNVMISEAGSVKLVGFVIDAVLHASDDEPATQESDVVNLGALLYAALVGRWPGSSGATIPDAPTEHGRPLRPRQVRAGVPPQLDAICERVLNAGAHPNLMSIGSAYEVYAALSDYIGDPGAAAFAEPAEVEPSAHLQDDALPLAGQSPGELTPDADETADQTAGENDDTVDTNDLPATGAMSALDPEATQASAPMFLLEDSDEARLAGTGARSRRAQAPPPPPPELPERPLFADGPSAAAAASGATHGASSELFVDPVSGAWRGTAGRPEPRDGSVPSVWGPDADEPQEDAEEWANGGQDRVPGRKWLWLAVVLAVGLLVVVGVVFVRNLGRGSDTPGANPSASPSPSATAKASTKVPISSVTDFDPEGDPPEENPDETALAFDGNPSTAWQTLTYQGNPKLGGLKSGVGLLVDLGKPTRVGEVRLTLIGTPTSLKILSAPGSTTAPSNTDGLSTVATAAGAGTDVALKLEKPTTTRWLVVWLTSLPPVPGGFKGQVAEVSVRS
jgi:serine/threonine protein kinase